MKTYRNGKARITFRPDYDANNPWLMYIKGTAMPHHCETLQDAINMMKSRYGIMGNWKSEGNE